MMRKTVILCIGLLLSAGAEAQTSQTIELTLDKAIEIALDENPTIKIADLEIERYDYVRKEYLGALYPNIGVTGAYTRNIKLAKLGGSIEIGGKNDFAAAANLTLPLFAPSVYSTLKLTKEQMNHAVEAARGSRITMVADVKHAYYSILLAQKSLEVLYASESTISETVNDTKVKYENGLASEFDLLSAEVQLSNLKPTIIQTKDMIEVTKMLLKMYLCIPENVNIALTGSLDNLYADMSIPSFDVYKDISGNSDLKMMELQKKILERQLKLQQTTRMPTVAAVGSFQITGNDMDRSAFAFPGMDPIVQRHRYTWQRPLAVGVQVSIPIFSGFSKTNKVKQIRKNIEQVDLQRDYMEESLKVSVNTAINQIVTAYEKVMSNELTIKQAQKAYDISKTRYDAGMGTMLEVNNAELQLTQAKLNHTQAVYDYLAAQADYEKVLGRDYYKN